MLSERISVLNRGQYFAMANLAKVQHLHGRSNLAVDRKEAP